MASNAKTLPVIPYEAPQSPPSLKSSASSPLQPRSRTPDTMTNVILDSQVPHIPVVEDAGAVSQNMAPLVDYPESVISSSDDELCYRLSDTGPSDDEDPLWLPGRIFEPSSVASIGMYLSYLLSSNKQLSC